MFFPPIIFMAAIFYAAYRKRNQFNTDDGLVAEGSYGENVLPEWNLADEAYLRRLVDDEP
jgi:hypothetical protein